MPEAELEWEVHLIELGASEAPAKPPPSSVTNETTKQVSFSSASPSVAKPVKAVISVRRGAVVGTAAPKRSLADVLSILQQGPSSSTSKSSVQITRASYTPPAPLHPPSVSLSAPSNAFRQARELKQSEKVSERATASSVAAGSGLAVLTGPVRFPSAAVCAAASRVLSVRLPVRFASLREYVLLFSQAVRETLHLALIKTAAPLFAGNLAALELWRHCSPGTPLLLLYAAT